LPVTSGQYSPATDKETIRVIKSPPGALSKDALLVADVSARLRRQGFLGDVFAALSPHLPDWTRERWEQALLELEEAKRKRREGELPSRVSVFEVSGLLKMG
jgi:hypothetical protein